jgi:hypothetical protein
MVRIKGANSDYIFDAKSGQIQEQSKDQPVYLKIYICPNDMPSQVEPPHEGQWCQGIDGTCPHPAKQPGHALISLHQTEGIALETPNTIAAKGKFVVQPKGKLPVFQAAESGVTVSAPLTVTAPLTVSSTLTVTDLLTITAPIALKTQKDNGTQLTINSQEFTLQTADGTKIQIKGNQVEITPGATGKVKVIGNLEVTGEITMAGKKISSS